MADQPLLSIVIATYTMDRLNDVLELLDAIMSQSYSRTETIVVVERSEELKEKVEQHVVEKAMPGTRVVFNHGEGGLSSNRNLGIREATGEIIAFIDDDAVPFPDWAKNIVETYDDATIIGATGPSIPLWEDDNISWVPEEFYWIIGGSGYSDWTTRREVRNVSGTNMSFRREAFEINGFFLTRLGWSGGLRKLDLAGEETEFCIRLRRTSHKRIVYEPGIKIHHRVYRYRVTRKFISRRAYLEGYTKAVFDKNFRSAKDDKVLTTEYDLLRRIATRLVPRICRGFFTHPVTAWRQFSIAVNATSCVAAGYCTCSFRSLRGRQEITLDA
ncbi:MAG: glycosyltransferase family 2 protein [Dehalococcoidia bacterium]|nr:glycosyltransferase family 2 protein [Dehalococcoidia bacterium]